MVDELHRERSAPLLTAHNDKAPSVPMPGAIDATTTPQAPRKRGRPPKKKKVATDLPSRRVGLPAANYLLSRSLEPMESVSTGTILSIV